MDWDSIGTCYSCTFTKLAVQKLSEVFSLWRDKLCFVSSSAVGDGLRLRNRQLLVSAKRRYANQKHDSATNKTTDI